MPDEEEVSEDEQLEFVLHHIEHIRKQTQDPLVRSDSGITEHRHERALDAFTSIVTRYKGRLLEDETIRDVMFAIGFETDDRCGECGRTDCPDYLERLVDADGTADS
jgi:hypothetical protein